jgi:mannan endo-1,4-beta-mannosidase
MRLDNITFTILAVTSLVCGCGSAGSEIQATLRDAAASGKILYGHQDDLMYGHDWNATKDADTLLERSDVKAVAGGYPYILGLDLGGIELGSANNLDGNDFALMRRAAEKHVARGGIVSVSWHLRNPLTGGDAWDVSSDRVVASILPGGEKHALFREWLKRVADYLETWKTEDVQPLPLIFRPWHEHIGSWFWWGGKLCTPDEYNALWRMTYSYLMKERGLTQLTWAISPNSSGIFDNWEERYPGDDYVDIIGVDCYANANKPKQTYSDEMRNCLASLAETCKKRGKILAVTETGLEGIPEADYWTGMLSPGLKGFPVAYVLTWRNASEPDMRKHYYAPFPGEPNAGDFARWIEQDHIQLVR